MRSARVNVSQCPGTRWSQHRSWNICGNIAVVVQMDDLADDRLPHALWSGVWEPHQFCKTRTKLGSALHRAPGEPLRDQRGHAHETSQIPAAENRQTASAYRQPGALHAL